MLIKIKPLSVNECWQGKRFKTKKYKQYEKIVLLYLPRLEIPEGKLTIEYEFGYSNSLSDIDNSVKPITDILQKKYNFNDNRIYRMILEKKVVPKGQEYVYFNIKSYNKTMS